MMKRLTCFLLICAFTVPAMGQGAPILPYIDSYWRDIIDESDTETYGIDLSGGTWASAVMNWDADPDVYANGTKIFGIDDTIWSTFLGTESFNNAQGQYNVGLGYRAGYNNDTTGAGAEGEYNVYIGPWSGYGETVATLNTGVSNIGVGFSTLRFNTSGYGNMAIGAYSLYDNTEGYSNVGLGYRTLTDNTTGNLNLAIGPDCLYKNTLGNGNIAIGNTCLHENLSASGNIAIGDSALYNKTSNSSIGIGYQTLYNDLSGQYNIGIGNEAGYTSNGWYNTYIGRQAGRLHTGSYSTMIGYEAGELFTSCDSAIIIGYQVGKSAFGAATDDNFLIIDNTDTATPLVEGYFAAHASGPSLIINGDLQVGNSTGIEFVDSTIVYDVNNISADVATFETYGIHIINSSGAGITGTLADGTKTGQSVKFVCKVAGNDIDISVSKHVTSDPEVIRLDTAKEWFELVWDGTDWVEVDGNGQSYP